MIGNQRSVPELLQEKSVFEFVTRTELNCVKVLKFWSAELAGETPT